MKVEDFAGKDKHNETIIKPTLQADVDRLEAKWKHLHESFSQGYHHICVTVLDDTKTTQHGPLTIVELNPTFRGLNVCTHCLVLAATFLRDAAQAIDDIMKEVPTKEG